MQTAILKSAGEKTRNSSRSASVTPEVASGSSSSTTNSDAPSAKRRLVENIMKSSARPTDADERKIMSEISSYLSCPVTASEADNALGFWKTRSCSLGIFDS